MRKQLLYLTNAHITATIWQGGRMSEGHVFFNNSAGWKGFAEYLGAFTNVPTYLLTDLIEEDFQRENIPHVSASARKNLIERRLTNLYRETPFRQATLQGREKEGRKDDRMLFSALTNPDLPKPWLAAILKHKVPLVGIYSAALLSSLVFKKMQLELGPLMLVTHQTSGLRTTYFHDGQLRFSRLTLLADESPKDIAHIADLEMAKTRQFLASTRLVARGDKINIVIITNAEILQQLQPLVPDTMEMTHRLIEVNDAAARMGLKKLHDITLFDQAILALLAQSPPSNQYKVFEHARFYTIWQSRHLLNFLRVVSIIGGLIWAGANSIDAIDAITQARRLEADTRTQLQRYQEVHDSMPTTLANPHDMKSVVELEQMLTTNAATPDAMLAIISAALGKVDNIKITQLDWQVSANDPTTAEQAPVATPPAGQELVLTPALIGVPTKALESVKIEGEIIPFKNDYRAALNAMNQFKAALSTNPRLDVKVIVPPLDLSPAIKLNGQAGNADLISRAAFTLKMSWKP